MKTFLKITKYFFLTLFVLIAVSVSYFWISSKIFLGGTDSTFTTYLENSKTDLNQQLDKSFFGNDLDNADVLLFGEIHGFADNQKVDEKLFKFANKEFGTRYYLAEMDSLTANKLNKFLSKEIKDENLLKEVVKLVAIRIPQQSGQQLFDKWSHLYDYNKSLAANKKITVLGIDANFEESDMKISRDSAMIVNFRNIVSKKGLQNEKFYGYFGLFHTLQSTPKNHGKTFANRLKLSGFKVTTFASHTLDSEMYLPKNDQFPTPEGEKIDLANADGPLMLLKGIKDAKNVTEENTITLFKLDKTDSPYRDSQRLLGLRSRVFGEDLLPENEDVSTVESFQYLVLLRNSGANSGLE